MHLIQQLVAVSALQLGADKRFIRQHVLHLEKIGELGGDYLVTTEALAGDAPDLIHSLLVYALAGDCLRPVPSVYLLPRVVDAALLLAQQFAAFRDGFRVDLSVRDGGAAGEHEVFSCWPLRGESVVGRVFRLRDGLLFLSFPFLAECFGDVDQLLVGGFREIRVRVGSELFDVACGARLCGLPGFHMPVPVATLLGHVFRLLHGMKKPPPS